MNNLLKNVVSPYQTKGDQTKGKKTKQGVTKQRVISGAQIKLKLRAAQWFPTFLLLLAILTVPQYPQNLVSGWLARPQPWHHHNWLAGQS